MIFSFYILSLWQFDKTLDDKKIVKTIQFIDKFGVST